MKKPIQEILSEGREIKLDIGCGPRKKSPDHIGIDRYLVPGVDMALNLEDARIPFPNNSVDEISASHVLEHISNYLPLIEELWRVLKPGGRFLVRVPHYLHENAYTDPTHVRRFTKKSFDFFHKGKIFHNESGWFISHARFNIDNVVETEREIVYDLTAKKKKILLIAPRESVHTRRWKAYLSNRSHDVKVASREGSDITNLVLGGGEGSKIHQVQVMPTFLERHLQSNQYDVVHAHFATRYGHLLGVVPKVIKRVLSVWGEDVLGEAQLDPDKEEILRLGLIHADQITTTSQHMKEFLKEKYPLDESDVWVIPWGYGDAFHEFDIESSGILRRFGIPHKGDVILSARVCRPQNNIERIISEFIDAQVDATLVVLTGKLADGSYVDRLKNMTMGRRDILFMPTLTEEELSHLYNRSTATLTIPEIDQLSTTLLESLACGTPVICSDIPVYKERVSHYYNGLFIDLKRPGSLSEAFKECTSDLDFKRKMKDAAKESVQQDSWESNAKYMLRVYDAPDATFW